MSEPWPHTGAVLAGGSSTRMGSSKEQLLLPSGETMLDAAITTLESLASRVVVVGRDFGGRLSVPDLRSGVGPLGGIEALLKSGIDQQYLVCPSDTPLVTSELLAQLTLPTAATATIFAVPGTRPMQTLPIRISADASDAVTYALDTGQNAIHSLLETIDVALVRLTKEQAKHLLNVNTPDDFRRVSE